jgi:hypothetical protein
MAILFGKKQKGITLSHYALLVAMKPLEGD